MDRWLTNSSGESQIHCISSRESLGLGCGLLLLHLWIWKKKHQHLGQIRCTRRIWIPLILHIQKNPGSRMSLYREHILIWEQGYTLHMLLHFQTGSHSLTEFLRYTVNISCMFTVFFPVLFSASATLISILRSRVDPSCTICTNRVHGRNRQGLVNR